MFTKPKLLQQKTDRGMAMGISVGMVLCLFLTVLLMSQFMLRRMVLSAAYLEDALACSNLAGAIIDIKEYGYSHEVVLQAPDEAYNAFLSALKTNLNLDDQMRSKGDVFIWNEIRVEEFILYNVKGGQIEIARFSPYGVERRAGYLGHTFAPNGQLVEKTGIYSEVSYQIRGYFGEMYQARKGKLVDVVAERS